MPTQENVLDAERVRIADISLYWTDVKKGGIKESRWVVFRSFSRFPSRGAIYTNYSYWKYSNLLIETWLSNSRSHSIVIY